MKLPVIQNAFENVKKIQPGKTCRKISKWSARSYPETLFTRAYVFRKLRLYR